MKTKFLISIFLFAISNLAFAQSSGSHALIGVDVFQGESDELQNMTILIEDGWIKDIFPTGSKALNDTVNKINLTGYYVIPGLIDTHVHMGQKRLPNSPEASREEFKKWIYSGVTSVRDMGGDARLLARENQFIREKKIPGPEIYFCATVGSSDMIAKDLRISRITRGIGSDKAGYVIEAKEDLDISESVSMALDSKVTGLKFYAGVNAKLVKALSDEAHKRGLKSWAHFTVFPDRPIEIVRAGVDVVSHVWGAFWQDQDVDPSKRIPFTHTDFKGARSAIFPDDMSLLNTDSQELQLLFEEMKKRNVIWDLTYVVSNPKTQEIYRKYALAASEAGITFSTGTDYFNDTSQSFPSVFTQIERLVEDGILSTRDAIVSATLNGAKVIGIEKTHGTIEKGKIGNLVVLKKNPVENIMNLREIEFTMKAGEIYHRKSFK